MEEVGVRIRKAVNLYSNLLNFLVMATDCRELVIVKAFHYSQIMNWDLSHGIVFVPIKLRVISMLVVI